MKQKIKQTNGTKKLNNKLNKKMKKKRIKK